MAGAIWVSSSVPQINAAPEYDTEKIFQYEGQEFRVPYREKMPPDTTACIFWLKNRKKAEWRDGVGVQHDATSAFLQVLDFLRAQRPAPNSVRKPWLNVTPDGTDAGKPPAVRK